VKSSLRFILLLASLTIAVAASAQTAAAPASCKPEETSLAIGLKYRHICSTAADGGPWSIHVLEASRDRPAINIRVLSGRGDEHKSEMQREQPTRMASRAAAEGANVLAVVNGDFDAAPLMGVSVGPSVTSGRLWTAGGNRRWPAFALTAKRVPVIGTPEFLVELRAGRQALQITAFNKPFARFTHPALYTRDFRGAIKSEAPFRATVIGALAPSLPVRVGSTVKGKVLRVLASATEIDVPDDALVLVEPISDAKSSPLRQGRRVQLRFNVRVAEANNPPEVVGGFPILVRDGRLQIEGEPGESLRKRHPRTAVCYNPSKVIFTVVDGRQPSLSVGMTLEELGSLMLSLGCTEAMNTDGGGSSVMAVRSVNAAHGTIEPNSSRTTDPFTSDLRIVNSPSDGKERGRGNAWIIEELKPGGTVAPAAAKN